MLDQVTTGLIDDPLYMIIFGVAGIGKTTLASQGESVIFLPTEKGTNRLKVARMPVARSFKDVETGLRDLATKKHSYKTLVIDSLDGVERLLSAKIAADRNVSTLEDIGYGKGTGYLLAESDKLKLLIEDLRERLGMNVLLLAHAKIEKFTDPSNSQNSYDRYTMKLTKQTADFWRDAVDAVLFAHSVVFTKVDPHSKKVSTVDAEKRVLHTTRRAGWEAKNRYGLPDKIDLDWDKLMEAIAKGEPESAEELRERIGEYVTEVTELALLPKIEEAIAQAGSNTKKLSQIANRLLEILSKQGSK